MFFVVVGSSVNLGSVLDFSDMMILAMAFPNIIGLLFLSSEVKEDLKKYLDKVKNGSIKKFKIKWILIIQKIKRLFQRLLKIFQNERFPYMNEWDEKQIFPIELFKKIGNLGMMGVLVPEEYGGSGLSYDEYVTIISELSKVCGSIGLSVAAHNSLCTGHILKFGNEDQKRNTYQNWLQRNI